MSSSTPETVEFAGIDAETSPPRVTSDMLFRFVVFYTHFNEMTSQRGKGRDTPAILLPFCTHHCSCAPLRNRLPLRGRPFRLVGMPLLAIHQKETIDRSVLPLGAEKKFPVVNAAVNQDQSCDEPSVGLRSLPSLSHP